MLIGSDFFETYDTTMCHKEGVFKIMGYSFPLLKLDGSFLSPQAKATSRAQC